MGKRLKSENKKEETIIEKKSKHVIDPVLENKHELQENYEETEQQSVSDNKEIVSNTEDKCLKKNKGRKKTNKPLTNNATLNKKIIFNDDNEAHEVPLNVSRKKSKVIEPQEEEPTEEDIDQFCAEIDEEDNAEYENWVKLIEEKLSSNKKKTK